MNPHHTLLQNEEQYSQSVEMIKASIIGIRNQINPIKKFLGDRKKEIVKKIRGDKRVDRNGTLEFTRTFYEYTLKELINIERVCEDCLVRLNIDLLTATKGRMTAPSYLSPEEMRKAYEMCCDVLEEQKDEPCCRCIWENKAIWDLDDVQEILAKPREAARTEFDDYDLKFKQDIIYLRTKMFSLPRKRVDVKSGIEIISGSVKTRASIQLSLKTSEFMEVLKQKEVAPVFAVEEEISKINTLKFIDGSFVTCDIWSRALDLHGNQYGSKWNLLLCPQIEKLTKKRLIPILHLDPHATFHFISTITNFTSFTLSKADLSSLLQHSSESVWLSSWNLQFQMLDGKDIAATMIQAAWRGYWLRIRKWHSGRMYIAASFIWYSWITLKAKREMHRRYLNKMLISLQATRDLTLKLSREYFSLTQQPHVVLHLPSIGHPTELRRILNPKMFAIYQNITILRICFVRNPHAEVVYILPVKPTQDLLMMYSDFIEAISPDEEIAKRITFIALSQAETFKNLPLNVSRILHCSEESLNEIRKKIAGRSAYFLPCVVDECDMRLSGNLNVPLLSPDMELQRIFLNASNMCEIIDGLGLLQPPHERNITDFEALCTSLAELMVLHTEVSVWLFKMNYGMTNRFSGIFLINHISVPFMPILRRERERHGDDWKSQPDLRLEFLKKMKEHLPQVIPSVTRLPKMYKSWHEFYAHVQRFGCLLQAVPVEKNPKTILASLFVPGRESGEEPKWLGTADKISLEATYSTTIYMLPQTSLDITKVQPAVNKFAIGMQEKGYFGYLGVDCYCYLNVQDEKLTVLILNVFPYYSYSQSYIDWMKFAIGGWYNDRRDAFISDVSITSQVDKRKSSFLFVEKTPAWNETAERYAIAITQLHHSKFSVYRWSSLKDLFESCNIVYDRKKKQGSSIILHDGEIRDFGKMVAVSPAMTTTLSMMHKNLTKLYQTLMTKSRKKTETNIPSLIDFFMKLSLDYHRLATDKCSLNL